MSLGHAEWLDVVKTEWCSGRPTLQTQSPGPSVVAIPWRARGRRPACGFRLRSRGMRRAGLRTTSTSDMRDPSASPTLPPLPLRGSGRGLANPFLFENFLMIQRGTWSSLYSIMCYSQIKMFHLNGEKKKKKKRKQNHELVTKLDSALRCLCDLVIIRGSHLSTGVLSQELCFWTSLVRG